MSLIRLLSGVLSVVMCFSLQAQETRAHDPSDHLMVLPGSLTWKDGPASLPAGVKFVILEGDPSKPGPFTMRLQLPPNYKVPPHWHPAIERVTVLAGAFSMGLGEWFDEAKATKLPVGGFAVMAIGTRHFAFTKEEGAIIQLHGIGPWGITYVNPADDPRGKRSER